ncbi:hypothetical protein OBBRIDRAFT_838116 [Obba rivulosa]|uniref:Uncharacterized protein n=1 Tax=Obba rivulosa TaxID=1052685 RepID=A0A8E2DI48_9APHY|nr:hypothetical protein OBBRIDRAFT_838116 [Obba rivulosa]
MIFSDLPSHAAASWTGVFSYRTRYSGLQTAVSRASNAVVRSIEYVPAPGSVSPPRQRGTEVRACPVSTATANANHSAARTAIMRRPLQPSRAEPSGPPSDLAQPPAHRTPSRRTSVGQIFRDAVARPSCPPTAKQAGSIRFARRRAAV